VKILTIIDSLGFGGAERLLCTLAAAAPVANLNVQVASLSSWTAERTSTVPRLEAAGIQPSFVGVNRLADPRSISRLATAIRESECDIVHAHLGYSATLVPLAARRAGRPSVCTLHTLPEQGGGRAVVKEKLCVEAAGRSSALIFVSEAARAAFANRYRQRASWRVVHNGINLAHFAPDAGRLPAGLGVPAGVPVVSIIAALRAPKGHALAIAGWHSVLSRVPEARLVIVGDGPEYQSLRTQAERAGLQQRVIFTGRIDDERQTADIIRASDLVLLPSYTEALPTTLIEAAACGRPVVATDVGGVREVVLHGVTGLLLEPGGIGQIADAVADLLEDRSRRLEMGRIATEVAQQHFNMYDWAQRLKDVYSEAILRYHEAKPTSVRSGG
jgi:glycosyltransferase involved in cell wall biosynthesis